MVFKALEQRFDASSQKVDRRIVQAAPNDFTSGSRTITDRVNLGYRQLLLYVLRHHREMIPGSTVMDHREGKKTAEGIHIPDEVDEYHILEVYQYGHYGCPMRAGETSSVTVESSQAEERKSGRPYDLGYKQSQTSIFRNNVHSTDESQGCGITPFLESPQQGTRITSVNEPYPGRGEAFRVETTLREAVDEETAHKDTLEDPSVLQSYLQRSFKETGEAERLMLDNAAPVKDHAYDGDSPNQTGSWERQQA